MKFDYFECVTVAPDNGDPILMLRPIISFRIHGLNGRTLDLSALVDTGADHMILPNWVAEQLAIPTTECLGPPSRSFTGDAISLRHGQVEVEIPDEGDTLKWCTQVFFSEATSHSDPAILGQMGFLEFFTATFDGFSCVLTLEPIQPLPSFN